MSNAVNKEPKMSYPNLNTATDPKIRKQLEVQRARVIRGINPIGRFMIKSRMVRMWRDGDGVSMLVNWWNPLAWVWVVLAVTVLFVTSGVSGVRKNLNEIGVRMSDYWRENRNNREWINPSDL
jgi:hypothetical protein